jgi:hypothetical protein
LYRSNKHHKQTKAKNTTSKQLGTTPTEELHYKNQQQLQTTKPLDQHPIRKAPRANIKHPVFLEKKKKARKGGKVKGYQINGLVPDLLKIDALASRHLCSKENSSGPAEEEQKPKCWVSRSTIKGSWIAVSFKEPLNANSVSQENEK